jgi:hypothetical protein
MTDPFWTVLKTCVPRLGRFATSHLLRAVLWCELQGGCRETAWAPGQCWKTRNLCLFGLCFLPGKLSWNDYGGYTIGPWV